MPGSRSASIKDVAVAAGVSVGTVSNVLNRPDRVGAANRQRVERAIAALGFVLNEPARHLRAGTSRTLAYLALDTSNPFFTDVAQGVEAVAELHGLGLMLCNAGGRAEREAAHLRLVHQHRVQGLLITPVDPRSAGLRAVRDQGIPTVVVDHRTDHTFCSVAVDDHLGGRLAVQHLLDRGHRRVAFVGGPLTTGQVADRLAGARSAWQTAGRSDDDLVVLETARSDVPHGGLAARRLSGLPDHARPTAAFCANDLLALGVLQHAVSTSVRVPHDLAIVGYDDIEFAGAAAVPLTSVSQPRRELGRAASDLLLAEVADPGHRHQQLLFRPELVARASTALA
ncbi:MULTISPECIES: LacI family DNA-binding transcriptional regulator [unclassified Nocardioides]|uniref:LacI family DNA-binding transcriptional regulator n=1 Tax=unclassified Nocardioides TaxID=2615069 RepID=UPI003014B800